MATGTGCSRRTVDLGPALPATLNPQQAGIGEVIVLQALVLLRQIGVAGASTINDIVADLPSH